MALKLLCKQINECIWQNIYHNFFLQFYNILKRDNITTTQKLLTKQQHAS